MPLTREEAVAAAPLIAACRPSGARRWATTEIVAALFRVRHLALGDVLLAAIRAAQDRSAESPFAITNMASPHWRERQGTPVTAPSYYDPDTACAVCTKPAELHTEHGEHAFIAATAHAARLAAETDEQRKANAIDYARQAIGDAKAERPPAPEPPPRQPNPDAERVRAQIGAEK